MEDVIAFAKTGRPVLGICNGLGILANQDFMVCIDAQHLTQIRARTMLRVDRTDTMFTKDYRRGKSCASQSHTERATTGQTMNT